MERKQGRFYSQSYAAPNPIITVTEHTPTPSPDYMKRQVSRFEFLQNHCLTTLCNSRSQGLSIEFQGSIDSQLDITSLHGSKLGFERKPSLTRSQTDSNITYTGEEIPEAPGSACYITKEGDIDYQVVLKVPD